MNNIQKPPPTPQRHNNIHWLRVHFTIWPILHLGWARTIRYRVTSSGDYGPIIDEKWEEEVVGVVCEINTAEDGHRLPDRKSTHIASTV